jgi:hypothetical protein
MTINPGRVAPKACPASILVHRYGSTHHIMGDPTMTANEHRTAKPIVGSVVAGLLASLCCGGSLIFTSIGLGAFYSTLGLSRYAPQALAAGALSILAINYLYYRHAAKQESAGPAAALLRQKMFVSAAIGLAIMAGGFILMEWLNHAVVHGDRFLSRAEYGQALIKGVPDTTLIYVGTTFFALAALWALPFPQRYSPDTKDIGRVGKTMRVAVGGVTALLLFGVLLDASSKVSGTVTSPHGQAH